MCFSKSFLYICCASSFNNFLVDVPKGASFDDMVKFKGKSNIGELINKNVLAKIAEANENLLGIIDKVDFDDTQKLGTGKEQVDNYGRMHNRQYLHDRY